METNQNIQNLKKALNLLQMENFTPELSFFSYNGKDKNINMSSVLMCVFRPGAERSKVPNDKDMEKIFQKMDKKGEVLTPDIKKFNQAIDYIYSNRAKLSVPKDVLIEYIKNQIAGFSLNLWFDLKFKYRFSSSNKILSINYYDFDAGWYLLLNCKDIVEDGLAISAETEIKETLLNLKKREVFQLVDQKYQSLKQKIESQNYTNIKTEYAEVENDIKSNRFLLNDGYCEEIFSLKDQIENNLTEIKTELKAKFESFLNEEKIREALNEYEETVNKYCVSADILDLEEYITKIVEVIDKQVNDFILAQDFKQSRFLLQFINNVLKRLGISQYMINFNQMFDRTQIIENLAQKLSEMEKLRTDGLWGDIFPIHEMMKNDIDSNKELIKPELISQYEQIIPEVLKDIEIFAEDIRGKCVNMLENNAFVAILKIINHQLSSHHISLDYLKLGEFFEEYISKLTHYSDSLIQSLDFGGASAFLTECSQIAIYVNHSPLNRLIQKQFSIIATNQDLLSNFQNIIAMSKKGTIGNILTQIKFQISKIESQKENIIEKTIQNYNNIHEKYQAQADSYAADVYKKVSSKKDKAMDILITEFSKQDLSYPLLTNVSYFETLEQDTFAKAKELYDSMQFDAAFQLLDTVGKKLDQCRANVISEKFKDEKIKNGFNRFILNKYNSNISQLKKGDWGVIYGEIKDLEIYYQLNPNKFHPGFEQKFRSTLNEMKTKIDQNKSSLGDIESLIFQKNKYKKANSKLEDFLKNAPDSGYGLFLKVLMDFVRNEKQDAINIVLNNEEILLNEEFAQSEKILNFLNSAQFEYPLGQKYCSAFYDMFISKDFLKAAKNFGEIMIEDFLDSNLCYLQGKCFLFLGDMVTAEQVFIAGLSIEPHSKLILNALNTLNQTDILISENSRFLNRIYQIRKPIAIEKFTNLEHRFKILKHKFENYLNDNPDLKNQFEQAISGQNSDSYKDLEKQFFKKISVAQNT